MAIGRGSFHGVGEVRLSTFAINGPNLGPFCSFFPEKRQKGPKCGPWRVLKIISKLCSE